jgi:predicted transposase YbfD/YdcC
LKIRPKAISTAWISTKPLISGHGRIEEREVTLCHDIDWLIKDHSYPHIASIVSVKSKRFLADKRSEETRYFISSITHNDAKNMLTICAHTGGVENNLHWTLDIVFNEDSCRIRKGYSDQDMAILRHISLNLLKSETEHKVGIIIKRQMAGWDSDYLLKLLQIF